MRLAELGGRISGRFVDGQWWCGVLGRVGSGRTLGEAIDCALRGGLN